MNDTATTSETTDQLTPHRVPWAAVAVYAGLACGLAWVAMLPVWLSGEGLSSSLFMPMVGVMMFTPTIAALIVLFTIVRPKAPMRYLGLTPFRPVLRSILVIVLAPLAWLIVCAAALAVAIAFGWVQLDLSLSAIDTAGMPEGVTAEFVLIVTLVALPVNTLVAAVPAFGEELGWRGFLTTALAPLGFWPSAVFSGLLWGVWHAPIILLGYNFFRPDIVGLVLMCGFTLFTGALLQWLRYWCRNVWVAAVAHGAINAVTPVTLMVLALDGLDPAIGTVLGVPGWIVIAVVLIVFAGTGVIGRHLPRPLVPAPRRRAAQGQGEVVDGESVT